MHVMAEGIEKAIADGDELTGEAIKTALETMPAVDTGGVLGSGQVKFSADSHRGNTGTGIYQVEGRPDGRARRQPDAGVMTSTHVSGEVAGAGAPGAATTDLLTINNVEVIYDDVILVLRGLSLAVPEGKIVALLGSNGAGKSTTLKAVSGLLPTEHGEVTDGSILFDGRNITQLDAAERVKLGLSLVHGGAHVFEHLTVEENLIAGAYSAGASTPRVTSRSTACCPSSATCGRAWRATSRAASSRCSPSAGRSWPSPSCSCSTSRRWGWRRCW